MKKITALLAALLISAGCIACTGRNNPGGDETGGTKGTDKTNVTGSDTGTSAGTEESLDPGLEKQDFGGGKMVFLCRDYGTNYNEIGIFEDSPNNVESAVYWRNFKLNEKYNIKIDVNYQAFNAIHTFAQTQMDANDIPFDIISCGPMFQINLAMNGSLYANDEIPVIDFTKAYWSQTVMADTSVANKSYFFVSDANMWAMNAAGVVFFNSDMIKDLQFEKSPYDLVNENAWTYDAMLSMSRRAYSDLDSDGVPSIADRFGSVSTYAASETMFAGLGGTTLNKDSDDIPELTITDQKNIDRITRVVEFWAEDSSLLINRYPDYQSPRAGGNLLADTLLDGRALFSQEQLYQLSTFVDSTYVIGMVPCPKYDENQKDYRTFIHVAHSSSFSLPNLLTVERLKQTATVLEDMAYLSRDGVKHEYYDVNLTIRRAQDEESKAMLDIIFSNMTIDLGMVLQASGFNASTVVRNLVFNKDTSVSSTLAGNVDSYNALLSNMVKSFTGQK